MDTRYLNQRKLAALRSRGKTQRVFGWILLATFVFGVVGFLTDGEADKLLKDLSAELIFVIGGGLLLFLGLRNKSRAEAAERFASIFSGDDNGVVTIEELTRATNQPSGKVLTMLNTLTRLGLFQNCVLESGGSQPRVVLSNAQFGTADAGYINVKCACCGGTTRIRFGTVGKCEYCGSPIRGDKE